VVNITLRSSLVSVVSVYHTQVLIAYAHTEVCAVQLIRYAAGWNYPDAKGPLHDDPSLIFLDGRPEQLPEWIHTATGE
jgi:hypothetical protein